MARWQNGYAEDCKSLYAGSIPARASILPFGDVRDSSQMYARPTRNSVFFAVLNGTEHTRIHLQSQVLLVFLLEHG